MFNLRYGILFLLGLLFVLFPTNAQDTSSMVEKGEWGILFDNNEGLHWISTDRNRDKLIVSNQVLFDMFTGFGQSNLSPDGNAIALTAGGENKSGGMYLVDVTSGETILLLEISDRAVHSQTWSPDGKLLAYCSDSTSVLTDRSIRVMKIETREEKIVIPQHFTFDWKGMIASPYFSCINWLDNNTLIFAATLYPPATDYQLVFPFSALFTVEINGSNFQQITPDNVDVGFPSVWLPSDFFIRKPDGNQVYFMCDATRDPQRTNKICRIDLATSIVEEVLELSDFGISASYENTIIPLDQLQDADLLTDETEEYGLETIVTIGKIVTSFAVSPKGEIAVAVFSTATNQEDIYLVDPDLHRLDYLAQGGRPRWFYYSDDL